MIRINKSKCLSTDNNKYRVREIDEDTDKNTWVKVKYTLTTYDLINYKAVKSLV